MLFLLFSIQRCKAKWLEEDASLRKNLAAWVPRALLWPQEIQLWRSCASHGEETSGLLTHI